MSFPVILGADLISTVYPANAEAMTSLPTAPMGKRAGPVQQQTSLASHDSGSEQGFTLLEVVCVVAILAILAGFVFPWLPRTTSRARLESYAIATAALL